MLFSKFFALRARKNERASRARFGSHRRKCKSRVRFFEIFKFQTWNFHHDFIKIRVSWDPTAPQGSPGLPRLAWGSPVADFDGEHPIQNRDQRSTASELKASFLLSTHQMGRAMRGRLGEIWVSDGVVRGGGGACVVTEMVEWG